MTDPNEVAFRPARAADAEAIVALVRRGFTPDQMGLFIYGCSGIEEFVRHQIEAQAIGGESVSVVACQGERIIGCTESGKSPHAQYWNWLSVEPDCRKGGTAKRLLKAVTELALLPTQKDMIIDVLTENLVALHWYQRLGFQHQHYSQWWAVPLQRLSESHSSGCIKGFAHARVGRQAFGFSQFRAATRSAEHVVGWLGQDWFRVSSREAVSDPELSAALLSIDPSRRLLAILREGELPQHLESGAKLMATTTHMTLDLAALLRALKDVRVSLEGAATQ